MVFSTQFLTCIEGTGVYSPQLEENNYFLIINVRTNEKWAYAPGPGMLIASLSKVPLCWVPILSFLSEFIAVIEGKLLEGRIWLFVLRTWIIGTRTWHLRRLINEPITSSRDHGYSFCDVNACFLLVLSSFKQTYLISVLLDTCITSRSLVRGV